MSHPLGLIAGNGRFPFLVAEAARRSGRRVVAVAVEEEAAPELAASVDEIHWVGLGQLGRCIEVLKSAGVSEAVMAGQVQHRRIFSGIVPDLKLAGVLLRLAVKNTDSLIGGVADALGREGIRLLPSTTLLADQMASAGAMSRRRPTAAERQDIAYGVKVARALAALDLGQTVVIKDRAAVALEAMEGTDEVIRRAGIAPSEVDQNDGQNAQPCVRSANRIWVTPFGVSRLSGAARVPSVFHVVPPSAVPSTVVHGFELPQGMTPRTQPWDGEIQLWDCARKPSGSAEILLAEAAGPLARTARAIVATIVPKASARLMCPLLPWGFTPRTHESVIGLARAR